jgi:hypothetical protein
MSLLVDPKLNMHSLPVIGHNLRPLLLYVCVCVFERKLKSLYFKAFELQHKNLTAFKDRHKF